MHGLPMPRDPDRLAGLNEKGCPMLPTFLLAALLMTPQEMATAPAPGLPGWKQVGATSVGDFAVYSPTLKRDGDRMRTFVRVRMKGQDGQQIIAVVDYIFDCRVNTVRKLGTSLFNEDGSAGGVMAVAPGDQKDEAIADSSPQSAIARFICK